MHLRDDIPDIVWPAHWSLLGGGAEEGETPTEAVVRELDEEVGLMVSGVTELFEIRDELGSGQIVTFFVVAWDGEPQTLPLREGVRLEFFAPGHLRTLTIPPFIRDGIDRYLAARRT